MLSENKLGLAQYEGIICPEQWEGGEILKNRQKVQPSDPKLKGPFLSGPKSQRRRRLPTDNGT